MDLDDSFVNQMKMSIQATGGVLSLASTTYKHYLVNALVNQPKATVGNATHNIATQVKSLKGLIVPPQSNTLTGDVDRFPISTGQSLCISEMQFKVGSILYPQEPIKFSNTNRGEMYNEQEDQEAERERLDARIERTRQENAMESDEQDYEHLVRKCIREHSPDR